MHFLNVINNFDCQIQTQHTRFDQNLYSDVRILNTNIFDGFNILSDELKLAN